MKISDLNASGNTLARVVIIAVLALLSVSIGRSPVLAQDGTVPEKDLPKRYVQMRERQFQRLSSPSSAASRAESEKWRLDYPHNGLQKIAPSDSELEKLRKERYNEALRLLDSYVERRQIDPTSIPASFLPMGARRVEEAELGLSEKPEDKIRARTNFLEFARQYEKLMRGLLISGSFVAPYEYDEAHLMRLEAQIKLLEAERQTGTKHPK
jgi:hypothetical protein